MRRRELLAVMARDGVTFKHRCANPAPLRWVGNRLEGCGVSATVFHIGGFDIRLEKPDCVWADNRAQMDWLAKYLGLEFIHLNQVEALLDMRGNRPRWRQEWWSWPHVYEALRGRHIYFCLRDIVHLFPPGTRCCRCNRRVRYPGEDNKRVRWVSGAAGLVRQDFCSVECREQQVREDFRKAEKQRRERRWLRKGQRLLKECRTLCRNPAKLREASLSRGTESTQGENSPSS